MRKLLIGMGALVAGVVGVSACSTKDNASGKEQAAHTSGVVVTKIADITPAAGTRAESVPEASKPGALDTAPKPRLTLVLGEGKGGFKFRSFSLSDEAKAKIDEMFGSEDVDLTAARFEIEGYTDNLGSKEVNDQAALAGAKATRQYLNEQYEIPLDRIKVISYGMDKPVADNSTPEGRALNRRVVIKVVD